MKIHAAHLHSVVAFAYLRGIAPEKWMVALKNPLLDVSNTTAMVSVEDFYHVLRCIRAELPEAGLGVRMGNVLNLNSLGLIYQISLQTTTIEEALHYLKTYIETTFPIILLDMAVASNEVKIRLSIADQDPELSGIMMENVLTIISRELSLMSASKVTMRLSSPLCDGSYPKSWLRENEFSLRFSPTILKASLRDHSQQQLDILIPEYLKLVESLKAEDTFGTKVKIATLQLAKPELPNLDAVADTFHLTPRTFQRRLSAESLSFRQIINELRKQISALLIRHNRFTISDIAYVLGYSEPAAFIHSFKKWYGDSPERVRRRF
jgi:AraC-like DNA-binding protein